MSRSGTRVPEHRRPRALLTAACAVGAVTLAVAAGVVTLLVTAALTPQPPVFVGAGVAAFLVVDALAARVVARRAPAERRRSAARRMFGSSAAIVLVLFGLTALVPGPAAPVPRPDLPGERLVTLPTGARLVVVSLPAQGPVTGPPIVVVPGGPGIPDLTANGAALGPLTRLGRDVHLYAPTGTDRSTRLPDPRGYGRARDVADLEALRAELGLDRVVLVGHSYGANVAAAYLTEHEERVDRLVLVSPGPLDPADTSGSRATAGLDTADQVRLYSELLAPRALLGYALLQVDPTAARSFLPDPEADARNDAVLTAAEPALRCPGSPRTTGAVQGSGFYALQYPQSRTATAPPDVRPALSGRPTPALIVKGSCDYLSWSSALDYADALPAARLLYLPAGHNAHQEQPDAVRDAVAGFLDGRAVGDSGPHPVPPDYAGPP